LSKLTTIKDNDYSSLTLHISKFLSYS